MSIEQLKARTQLFALGTIRLVNDLRKDPSTQIIANQLIRAGTSVGANYRAACLAKSRADFISKMKIVEEECDESLYWMELLVEFGRKPTKAVQRLRREAKEILSIVVASIKTARAHLNDK
jgi:four helix bundle protein